jgi:type IV secretory pathway ATPase VirB11/archaellum biosynthesis ATPase
MSEVQKIIAKLEDFIHQEKDENNPHLEITLEEAKILLDLTY